jgi:general secretion pathway protein D
MSLETHVHFRRINRPACALAAILAALPMGGIATAQDAPSAEPSESPGTDGGMNRPVELPPETAPRQETTPAQAGPAPAVPPASGPGPAAGRKPAPTDELVGLQFRDTEVKGLIDTISLWTGKVVIPKQQAVGLVKITVVSDRLMPKGEALNLIFQAFRLNNLGVVETDDMILIDNLTELPLLQPAKVLGPDVDVMDLPENGNIVTKVFRITNTKAGQIYDRIADSMPGYAKLQPDNNSNQLILEGDIALAKRVQRMIDLLDVPAYVDVRTKTIQLNYQDAQTIANIITELFSARTSGSGGGGGAQRAPAAGQNQQQRAPRAPGAAGGDLLVGTSEQLIVTVLAATNSMTIRAEPAIMKEIESLIAVLDSPSSGSADGIFRLYDLKYTDPIKVQTVLQSLLEGGGGARRTGGAAGARGNTGAARVAGLGGGGAGGESGADVAIANIFRIEAYPDSNRLIIVSKTPDNFKWLDALIAQIDQPLEAGMPLNIPLKHASAVELAEILNALLAQSGATATIRAPEEGLSGIDFNVASTNGTSNTNAFTSGNNNPAGGGAAAGQIQFPWQSGRAAGEDAAEVSALVGKSRVVPNAGQNSLLVLAPPEIQQSLSRIIEDLDKPGRQVMISVVLAEVQLGDELALGVKWGPGVSATNPNNAVAVAGGNNGPIFTGSKTGIFPPDLTTSVLNFALNVNVVLQALAAETNVRILQQPRIFTSDNKEAKFFQGQDIPFQASSLSDLNTGGGVNATFEQIPVGIGLNVRPRITKDENVNMQIEVLLSNQNRATPQGVGGNPVIDRRQTNTTVTVKNGQTIVLSGIRRETENKIKNKVPVLGDVPVLDWVFANTNEVKEVTELLVFVTPTVVDNPDVNDTNYNAEERERLRILSKPLAEAAEEMEKKRNVLGNDKVPAAKPDEPLKPVDIPPDLPPAPKASEPAPGGAAPGR